jgi:hypothetical protein
MEWDTALRTLNNTKRLKDTRYIVRRPSLSLKDDHQSGKIDILSMYSEIFRLTTVVGASISLEI